MRPTRSSPARIEPLEARIALAIFTVTSTADSGAGSFRQAILHANANPGADEIVFDFSASSHMIELASALPMIAGPTAIVGDETMVHSTTPRFLLSGLQAGSTSGLRFGPGSPGSSVSGLAISGFALDGIEVANTSDIVITGCLIGALAGPGNGGAGIRLVNATNVTIGGHTFAENLTEPNRTEWGESNIIAGNRDAGIVVSGGAGHAIHGNLIGITAQNEANPNAVGIHVQSGSLRIGGPELGAGNIISGNTGNGIRVDDAGSLVIEGNRIGTDIGGAMAVKNGSSGIFVSRVTASLIIGGSEPGEGNLISGNNHGISLSNQTSINGVLVAIQGNFIGTDETGTKAIPNRQHGISVLRWSDVVIGGTTAGAMNLISGNLESGVVLAVAHESVVRGNYIGVAASGKGALANGWDGVSVAASTQVEIGGRETGAGNVISGNSHFGVSFDNVALGDIGVSGASSHNLVEGNRIGTDYTGTVPVGNALGGVFLAGVSIKVEGNVISANGAQSGRPGLHVTGSGHLMVKNVIGLDASGTFALPNSGPGINGSGASTISQNTISGNRGNGLNLSGNGMMVEFNKIGTDVAGGMAIPNRAGGVRATGSATFLQNVVSGNIGAGFELSGGVTLIGNYIGTDATGTKALGNVGAGVRIPLPYGKPIDSPTLLDSNVIAANRGAGFDAPNVSDLTLLNNRIGVGVGGEALGNDGNGIRVNVFNMTLEVRQNTIGANGGHGIALTIRTHAEAIELDSNLVGLAVAGQTYVARGNGGDGIHIEGEGRLNTEQLSISHNRIAANGGASVHLKNLDFDHNYAPRARITRAAAVIAGNTVGGVSDLTNADLQKAGPGIVLENTTYVRVGLTGAGNCIGGQAGNDPLNNAAIKVIGGHHNSIGGNFLGAIGTAAESHGHIYVLSGSDHIVGHDARPANSAYPSGGANTLIGSGIYTRGDRTYISGNNLTESTLGIVPAGGSHHEIVNNVIVNSSRGGIGFDGGNTFANVAGNVIRGASEGGITGLGSGSIARDNMIEDVTGVGISVSYSEAVTITGNIISGTTLAGIHLAGSSGSTVAGNFIERFAGAGIRYASGNASSSGVASENTIRAGAGAGIDVSDGAIELQRNVIYGNTGIPIDLGGDGPTRNDVSDADAGANDFQNSVTFRSVVARSGELILRGSFDGAPSRLLRIEFFNFFLGADGEEEASHFLGETLLETDAAGRAALAASFPLPGSGQRIFATVTDLGNRVTSEASLANILAGHETIAIGTGAGARGVAELVRAQMPNETLLSAVPYGTKYRGGVHVAQADLDGDGLDDLITAPARGGKMIRAFSGLDGSVIAEWAAAPGNYRGGISIAAGDLDGDGAIELAVARRGFSKPVVSIHDALTGGLESQFTAFAGARRSGLNLSTGDLDGDGDADLVGSWATGSAVARAFTVAGEPLSPAIRPFEKQVSIGAFTAVIPATSASPGQIAIGSGYGARAAVEVFDTTGALLESVAVFKHRFAAGIRLAAADVDGDGVANIIAARGAGVSKVEALAGDGRWLGSVFSPAVRSGIFIA